MAGGLYDLLEQAAGQLLRGDDGCGKYLTLTPGTLRQIAERKPASLADLARVRGMNEAKAERFGPAFLEILMENA